MEERQIYKEVIEEMTEFKPPNMHKEQREESKSLVIGKTEGELYLIREELFFTKYENCLVEA